MGIIKGGVFGNLNGKIGNRVYYMLLGKQVSRLIGRNTKNPSLKQLANRQAMKVAIEFFRPIKEFINVGFGPEAIAKDMYPHNVAISYNKPYALKGVYPEIEVDFEKVMLSKGRLSGLRDVSMRMIGDERSGFALEFNWQVWPEDMSEPRCSDQVMLMAYFWETKPSATVCYAIGAKREEGRDVLKLTGYAAGKGMEVYVALVSEDRNEVSNSQYLGRIITGSK